MKNKTTFLIIFIGCAIVFTSISQTWAKTYRLGVPKGYTAPTYNVLFESLREKGFIPGENLLIVPIDLSGFKTEAGKKRIRQEMEKQCDLFFTTGANLRIIFKVEPKIPLLFRATYSPQSNIPLSMKENTTGFYWDSTTNMFRRTIQLLPSDQRKNIGMIFHKGSSISNRVSKYKESCKSLGIDLVVKTYQRKEDIEHVMREFKDEGVKGLFLFPPSVRKGELAELIKWQNLLKLPLLGKVKSHIEKGVLGGSAIDYKIVNPKLTEYLIKLLQGRKPTQLPINYLSLKIIVNLNTVNLLGIDIPQEVLEQAEIVGMATQKKPMKVDLPPLVPGNYVIGTAKNIPNPTLPLLIDFLAEWGYVEGKNLRVEFIDLHGVGDLLQSRQIAKQIASKTDIFFATGNFLPLLFELQDLKTPVCFIATKETANIPYSLKHNFTGIIRDTHTSIIDMAMRMMPQAKNIGFLFREKSNLDKTIASLQKITKTYGVSLEPRTFSTTAEIGSVMKDLNQHNDFILLFPPSIEKKDLTEIVKWQNQLRLPVVAQVKDHIEAGLIGGPIVDFDVVLPKLVEYMHKLLHGRSPEKLPIYYPSRKYVINLKTANIIKMKIPDEITAISEIVY